MASVVLVALACVGCGGGRTNEGTARTTSTRLPTTVAESTTSSTPSPEAEVLAAYRAFWDDYIAAGDPMNPAHPRLEAHATGRELDHLRTEFTKLRTQRIVIRGAIELGARVTSLEGNKAEVEDCHDASKLLKYDARTGELRDTVDTRRSLWHAELTRTPSGWKVEFLEQVQVGCEPRG